MARQIKLNGREQTMMRTIGFGQGISGAELVERMAMLPAELIDVLNTLLEAGFLETSSMRETVTLANYAPETYEINPAFSTDLRDALRKH